MLLALLRGWRYIRQHPIKSVSSPLPLSSFPRIPLPDSSRTACGDERAMKLIDLLLLPRPPYTGFKKRVLDEFLHNPFLDDDLQELSLRLGASRSEVSEALGELCQARFLKSAGQRGYLLDLSGVAEASAPPRAQKRPPPSRSLRTAPPQTPLLPEWIESLQCGVVLLGRDGGLVLANERAVAWLGISREALDRETLERATGFDPLLVLESGFPACFSRREPAALEVEVRPCQWQGAPAVLIALQDISLREELSRIQARFQEAFFARLRQGLVEPLQAVAQFLENPDPQGLGPARAAAEEIRWFLEDLLLKSPPSAGGEELDFNP